METTAFGSWSGPTTRTWTFPLEEKAVVLRTGFKHYPACRHLQEYLRECDGLLKELENGDVVAEIIITGGEDMEKFCARNTRDTADAPVSLPTLFWFQMKGIEPGPRWDVCEEDDLSYQCRHQLANESAITIHTTSGKTLTASGAPTYEETDQTATTLSDVDVVAKFHRLAKPVLDYGVRKRFINPPTSDEDREPNWLYGAMMKSFSDMLQAGP